MTLEDAIKHAEEVALQKEAEVKEHNPQYVGLIRGCQKCADEYTQLAEWLKELREIYAMLEGCADTDELFVGYIRKRMKGEI